MTFRSAAFGAVAAATILVAGAAARAQDCVALISQNPQLSAFSSSLDRFGITNLLRTPGPFTILAPTNAAIGRLPINVRNDLTGQGPTDDIDPIRGPAVMNAHIVDGRVVSNDVTGQDRVQLRTRNGNLLTIQRQSDGTYTLRPGWRECHPGRARGSGGHPLQQRRRPRRGPGAGSLAAPR